MIISLPAKPTAKTIIFDWLSKRGGKPFSNSICINECTQMAVKLGKYYSATTWVKILWEARQVFSFKVVHNNKPETYWKIRRIRNV